MNDNKMMRIVALVAAVLLVASAMYIAVRPQMSAALGDCRSLATYNAERANEHNREYLEQELRACLGEDLDKSDKPTGDDNSPEDSPSPGASISPTTSPGASTPPSAEEPPADDEANETADPDSEEGLPRQWEFLANRAPIEKTSINAFGIRQGLAISKNLDDKSITAEEALVELRYRLSYDPMVAAATGAAFNIWGHDEIDTKTRLFAEDHGAWDYAVAEIEQKLDKAIADGKVAIVQLNGWYDATWSIPGKLPSVQTDMKIWRNGQLALSIDGKLLQIRCGFQEYWERETPDKPAAPPTVTPMPDPGPGMTRTPNGTPTPKTKPTPTPTPTDEPSEEPSHEPTPTPTPTDEPSEEPSHEPTPTPTPTDEPSEEPSHEPKPSDPGEWKHDEEKPKVPVVTEPPKAEPDPVVTEEPGGNGIVDNPTNPPGSESGVTAPGADPAPPTTQEPLPPADGTNTPEPGDNACVPAPGMDDC